MDPFTIALGVLQITGIAIKVSLVLQKKIKVFRNYSQEVKRVFKGVDRQQKNFLHEIHLLLRLARQDEDDIEHMLQDAGDPRWSSRKLQTGLNDAFPKSLSTVQGIIEDIGSTMQSLQGEIACFDEIVWMGEKNELLKDTVRRVRKRVKITWNKESLEEQIKNLRELNDDLRRLREQAAEIQQPVLRSTACVRSSHQLSEEFGSIGKVRRASKAFHQALATAWVKELSRWQPAEVRHQVKLKLDTQVQDEVEMEVVIGCHGHGQTQTSIQAGFISVQVQSRILDFMESGLNTPPHCVDDGRKRRKVRFNFEDDHKQSTIVSPTLKKQDPTIVDLRVAQNICAVLQGTSIDSCDSRCLGYLDSCYNETFRHSFFGVAAPRPISESICVSTEEILSRPAESSVTLVDQLTLARNFALAVLKFHSTPWLRDYVTIQDFSFFRFEGSDLSSCLQTVHLGSDFVNAPLHDNCPIEDMVASEAIEEAKLAHGVRNLTLWGLGTVMYVPSEQRSQEHNFPDTALVFASSLTLLSYPMFDFLKAYRLQIGTWSALESPDDVVAVRRLAQKVPMLGKRYRDLTKQCLECDFAFGEDLSKPRLQQAVYEHVVCGLTEMIKTLDIQED